MHANKALSSRRAVSGVLPVDKEFVSPVEIAASDKTESVALLTAASRKCM